MADVSEVSGMADPQTNQEFDAAFSQPLPTSAPSQTAAPSPAPNASGPVNMINPAGQVVSIDSHQMPDAISEGYREATPEETNGHFMEQKYGSAGQQAITGLEGAGSAATFGLSTGLERMAGVNPEDMRNRRETNPIAFGAGQAAGLVGSSFLAPGAGAAGAMEAAGEAGARALGLGADTALSKIGSGAVKAAIENSVFAGGDEVSKMITNDPGQTMGTAAANIGLAGLLGGGIGGTIGATGALWHATAGPKIEAMLNAFSKRAGGIEGVTNTALDDAITASGVEMPPEIKSALSDDPQLQQMGKILEQSDNTSAGAEYQASLGQFKDQADHALVGATGRTMDQVPSELSTYEHGKNIGNTLAKEYDTQLSPLSKEYDTLSEKFKGVELDASQSDKAASLEKATNKELSNLARTQAKVQKALNGLDPEASIQAADQLNEIRARISALRTAGKAPGTMDKIAEDITSLSGKEGWAKNPSGDIAKQVNGMMKELPLQKTLADLTQYIKNVPYKQMDPQFNRAMGMVKGILRDHESNVIADNLSRKEGVSALERYENVRKAYKVQSDLKDALDDRLHLRSSTGGYAKALREASQTDGEAILRKLSGKGDADLLNLLKEKFPATAKAVKDYHINNLLYNAGSKAKAGEAINAGAFLKHVDGMSPELKSFVLDAKAQGKIGATGQLLEKLNAQPHNFSNTARTMDRMMQYVPESGAAIASAIMGHNPIMGAALGYLGKLMSKDVPDAARLAMLKFMSSGKPISSPAFKAVFDTMESVVKGEAAMSKGVKGVFKAAQEVAPQAAKISDRKKLIGYLDQAQLHPESLAQAGNNLGHYMPDHAAAAAQISANAVNFLNGQRPPTSKASPLDSKLPASPEQTSHFNRMLDLANNPLSILAGVRSGRVVPEEVVALNTMFPGLHQRMVQKLSDEMTAHITKGQTIPYSTRIGMSLFMGQPMDSTLSPMAIMSNQPHPEPQQAPNGGSQARAPAASSMKGLDKLPTSYMTPGQTREQHRATAK
jgi:hypothetical protein